MQFNSKQGRSDSPLPVTTSRAFSHVDLALTLGVVALLAAWFAAGHTGERGRTARCANNLKLLGQAMHGYANDHADGLPAAGIDLNRAKISWDALVFQYSDPHSAANHASKHYVCPDDNAKHGMGGSPRSYAMGANDMLSRNWPPGPDSATGVGLWWDDRTVLTLLSNKEALTKFELLPDLKLSMLPLPANTLLLTEWIAPNNNMRSIGRVTVSGTSQQRQFLPDGGVAVHHGKFNYLMVDGHVESLSELQTGGFGIDPAGIWTIKSGD